MILHSQSTPTAHEATAASHIPHVLVIDDTPDGAAATASELSGAGYATESVGNGDAALRSVRAELVRLVISELYIGCAEGPCVVTALKNDRYRLPRLRVLTFSRHTTPHDDAWALAAGADSVLHKPASARTLVREVRRLEGQSGAATVDGAEEGQR